MKMSYSLVYLYTKHAYLTQFAQSDQTFSESHAHEQYHRDTLDLEMFPEYALAAKRIQEEL